MFTDEAGGEKLVVSSGSILAFEDKHPKIDRKQVIFLY